MKKQTLFYIHDGKSQIMPNNKALVHGITQYYVKTDTQHLASDDLYKCMKILLCFGRLIGIVPISNIFSGNLKLLSFRVISFAGITCALIIVVMAINDALALFSFFRTPAKDASEIARNAAGFFCYAIGLYVYVFMYRNTAKLIECFHKWRDTKTVFYKEDTNLFKSVTMISGIIYTSAILENMVSHYKFFIQPSKILDVAFYLLVVNNVTVPISTWEAYYERSHGQYARVIPYNIVLSIGIFLCNKWAVYAWNFGDILIAVIARAIYKRFELHYEDMRHKMTSNLNFFHDSNMWNQTIKDHDHLVDLLGEFVSLLSPLVFACVSTNIYFICLQLNLFLIPSEKDLVSEVYGAWSFIHLILRTFIAIVCCAKVNDFVHKIEDLLSKCPVSVLTKEVERTELKLRTSTIGFGGLDCFTITKPFVLSVISVIFTFEIVLLQSSMTPAAMAVNSTK